jgi:hypothetical protein
MGAASGQHWGSMGAALGQHWGSSGAAVGRQWGGSGAAVGRQWGGSGAAVGRQWGSSGAAVGQQWDSAVGRAAADNGKRRALIAKSCHWSSSCPKKRPEAGLANYQEDNERSCILQEHDDNDKSQSQCCPKTRKKCRSLEKTKGASLSPSLKDSTQ